MSADDKKAQGGLFSMPRAVAPGNQLQIDIGNYQIFSGDTKVGEVWVALDPDYSDDPAYTIEYWCLASGYVQPSSTQPNVGVSFLYATGLHASLSDFQAYARAQQASEGARYIVARCQEQAA